MAKREGQKTPESIADEIASWWESAAYDIAMTKPWLQPWADDKTVRWHARMVKNGCTDLVGAYADEVFDDPEVARDFMGDRLCDAAGDDDDLHDAAVEELSKRFTRFTGPMIWDELRRKKVSDE